MKKKCILLFSVCIIFLLSIPALAYANTNFDSKNMTVDQQKAKLEKFFKMYPPDSKDVAIHPNSSKNMDLSNAPDSIANIEGVVVDYEYNPILMYSSDPYSWGRHLLGIKRYDTDGTLCLTTRGYVTYYTTGGNYACAVPCYWSDVNRGDYVVIQNLLSPLIDLDKIRTFS